jgi:hypothetical protein
VVARRVVEEETMKPKKQRAAGDDWDAIEPPEEGLR